MIVFNLIVAVLAVILSGFLGFWVQDRALPVSDYKAYVTPPEPRPGMVLHVRHQLLRKRICHLRLQQVVFDSNRLRYSAPIQEYIVAPGSVGPDDFVTSVTLPPDVVQGPAIYRPIRAYYCNPLQWVVDWPIILNGPDINFTIHPAP